MSQPLAPPPPFLPPAAAPPGAAPDLADKKLRSLGTTCLVLAIIDICWVLYQLASAALSPLLMKAQKDLMGPLSGGVMSDKMLEKMGEFTTTIAIWTSVRMLPFLIASVFLLVIALRLRKGDHQALLTARTWVWAAIAVVVVSLLINLFVILPINTELQRAIFSEMPTGPGAPPGFERQMQTVTAITGIATMFAGALLMAAWPVILLIWSGKLLKERQSVAQHFD